MAQDMVKRCDRTKRFGLIGPQDSSCRALAHVMDAL